MVPFSTCCKHQELEKGLLIMNNLEKIVTSADITPNEAQSVRESLQNILIQV